MKKTFFRIIILIVLFIIYSYILVISNIPNNIVIFEGENIELKSLFGLKLDINNSESIQVSVSDENKIDMVGKTTAKLSLFDNISIKNINVDVLPKTKVIPVGTMAGLKLYTRGVLVVGMSELEGIDNKKYKPFENTGIKEGDTIIEIDSNKIESTEELIEKVNNSNGNDINLKYVHDEETKECSIKPVKTSNNQYKLGLWVRDSAAGVGTVTFYDKDTRSFGALGHGITDIDTEKLINIESGEFVSTKIINIIKGENGTPGKIQGSIENGKNIGTISKNTKFGIFGRVDNLASLNIDTSKEMEVALRDEIKLGKATILCSLDNNNVESYEIEIEKINKQNNYDNKSMQIKVTDYKLIEKTGGIIQGMSGSPIIQNGKFVGAITHVMVQNPTEGYAVFGDMMIKKMRESK